MTFRRATDKERKKYGVANRIVGRRKKPIIPALPPPAPWSIEATAAYDATAIARDLPPMMALNLRRIEGSPLHGVFDLNVPHWHLTLRNCRWFVKARHEWVGLPNRDWTDRNGVKHYEEVVVFSDVYAERFAVCALEALHCLLARTQVADAKSDEHQTPPQPLMNGNGSSAVYVGRDADDVPF